MSERVDLLVKIAQLEARRTALMAEETRLHNAFMAEDDEVKADRIAADLQNICYELGWIGDEIGIAKAQLYLIEAPISRREFLEDHPVGGRML